MNFIINGDNVDVPQFIQTVGALLEHFNIDGKVVIVELNGEILDKESREERLLSDGDKIELVQFVGGG